MTTLTRHQPTILRRYNLAAFVAGYLAGMILATVLGGVMIFSALQQITIKLAPIADSALSSALMVITFIIAIPALLLLQWLNVRAI